MTDRSIGGIPLCVSEEQLANSVLRWHILDDGGSKKLVGFVELEQQTEFDLRSGEKWREDGDT